MIQRIQSIWLLLAAITIGCLMFLPTVTSSFNTNQYQVLATGLYQKTATQSLQIKAFLPLFIGTLAVIIICLVNIFNYKNRLSQKRITRVSMVFIIGLSFWFSQYAKQIPGGITNANFGIGLFLPIIALFFCVLALKGINNDEKLIKAADRLR